MDRPLTQLAGASARSLMARRLLDVDVERALGSVTLRAHQRDAIIRVRAALDEHGGCLIADDVGLGKTFIALAIAAHARHPLVVGPASLRAMWSHACAQANVRVDYRSYESLSRAPMRAHRHDLIVLDEAHHARTPRTARYRHLADGLLGAHVVLLTATPIHNSARDLRALLALFLGARAWVMDESELADHVIRRQHDDVSSAALPSLAPAQWITLSGDESLLEAIISLPPAVPPQDGGDGGVLLSFTLARLWASSHAALRAALIRRIQRACALEDALSCGRHPTTSELRAWTIGEDAGQLAFAELVATSTSPDAQALACALRKHVAAIEMLTQTIPPDSPRDRERAGRLLDLVARHRGEKIVAFTQFADTANVYFRLVRDHVRSCQLDGRGARVAGGRLSRTQALARFAPVATGAREPPAAERIDLLIATDLLSEGVNLHDASVVVHLDLPWTSARIAQRVGRSRRLGARHSTTSVYAFAPPAAADALLRQEQRLRDKLYAAARVTGACGAILPVRFSLMPDASPDGTPAPARSAQLVRDILHRWREADPLAREPEHALPFATVRAARTGAIALVTRDNRRCLVAILGARLSDRPPDVLTAATLAEGSDVEADHGRVALALTRVESWLNRSAGAAAAGIGHTIAGTARRVAMRRIARIASHTPSHHRARVAPLAAQARRVVTAPYGVGAERILGELAEAPLSDEAWLRALQAFGEAQGIGAPRGAPRGAEGAGSAEGAGVVEAIIVFGP